MCRRISSGRIVAAARTVALSYSLPLDTGEGGAPGAPEPLEQALIPAVDKIRTLNLKKISNKKDDGVTAVGLIGGPRARLSTVFTEQADPLDHHSAVEGFCHVVYREKPYGDSCEGLHLDSRLRHHACSGGD